MTRIHLQESTRFRVYRCPECGKVAEGWERGPRYCAGNQWLMETPLEANRGDHSSVEMERLLVEIIPDPAVEVSHD